MKRIAIISIPEEYDDLDIIIKFIIKKGNDSVIFVRMEEDEVELKDMIGVQISYFDSKVIKLSGTNLIADTLQLLSEIAITVDKVYSDHYSGVFYMANFVSDYRILPVFDMCSSLLSALLTGYNIRDRSLQPYLNFNRAIFTKKRLIKEYPLLLVKPNLDILHSLGNMIPGEDKISTNSLYNSISGSLDDNVKLSRDSVNNFTMYFKKCLMTFPGFTDYRNSGFIIRDPDH